MKITIIIRDIFSYEEDFLVKLSKRFVDCYMLQIGGFDDNYYCDIMFFKNNILKLYTSSTFNKYEKSSFYT